MRSRETEPLVDDGRELVGVVIGVGNTYKTRNRGWEPIYSRSNKEDARTARLRMVETGNASLRAEKCVHMRSMRSREAFV
jgi:hypothetical protein